MYKEEVSLEKLQRELKTKLRKPRCDKGKPRGSNSKVRSDKGEPRDYRQSQLVETTKYARIKSRLLNEEVDPSLYEQQLSVDANGIFNKVVKKSQHVQEARSYVSKGTKVNRMSYHIAGSTIDLEEYRFKSLQELVLYNPVITERLSKLYYYELRVTGAKDWFTLYCRLYHISPIDAFSWTYVHWRHDYEIVKGDVLIDDFVFNIDYSPGSKEFLPDYLTELNAYREELRSSLRRSKKWADERAIYKFELTSREDKRNREHIYAENPDKTAHQLNLLLRKARDMARIEQELNEHMVEWENEQLKITIEKE